MVKFKNNISKELKLQAQSLGACEKGLDGMDKLNEQGLINRYIHFIDFCIGHDYPSNDFIKNNFNKQLLEHNNIYVDTEFERRNARQVVVVQGSSRGMALYDGYTTADVYVRHSSEVTFDCSRMSKIFISVYDNAKINVIQREGASVYVYIHSDNCDVKTEGDVMIRHSSDLNQNFKQ